MRALGRYVLITGPFRLYEAGERSGGAVSWSFMAAYVVLALSGGAMGAALGTVLGRPVGDYLATGLLTGIFAMLAWSIYAAVVLVVAGLFDVIYPSLMPRPPPAGGGRGRHVRQPWVNRRGGVL